MPLTPAHAAAVWPIARLAPRLPVAALVIGALSPDFEYLLRLAPRGELGHSLPGLILFCLPASVVAWFLFEALIRPALLDLLPPGIGVARAHDRASGRARLLGWVAVAASLGAITHLGWDAFTHEHGWAVRRMPALHTEVILPVVGGVPWYEVLQHASTLAGALVICAWLARSWLRAPSDARRFAPGQRARTLRILALCALAALIAGALNAARATHAGFAGALGFAVVGAMVGLVLAFAAFGATIRAAYRTRRASR